MSFLARNHLSNSFNMSPTSDYSPQSDKIMAEKEAFIRELVKSVASESSSDEHTDDNLRGNASGSRRLKKQRSTKKLHTQVLTQKQTVHALESEKRKFHESLKRRKYCDSQLMLISRQSQNGKMADVARYTDNLLTYLVKNDVDEKWFYVAAALFFSARSQLQLGNLVKAKVALKKIQDEFQNCDHADIQLERDILEGEILVSEGRYDDAAQVWDRACSKLKSGERKCWMHHELARCYLECGKVELSYHHAEMAAIGEYHPWKCYGLLLLGQVLVSKKKFKEAIEKFEIVQDLSRMRSDSSVITEKVASAIAALRNMAC